MSTAVENKAIFRRYAEEVGNQLNMELVDEIFDRYISHQPDGSTLERGPQGVKRFHREFRSAFPDFHISIEDQIAEGDKVVSHYTIRGTHQGDFRGLAPTGKEIELKGVTTFRFSEEGKSKREIIRCLKRYVAREVYRVLISCGARSSPIGP